MMKKENLPPNYANHKIKKPSNKTPDSSSTKATFKPRFIVKDTVSVEPDRFSMNSPQYTDTRSSSTCKNWK